MASDRKKVKIILWCTALIVLPCYYWIIVMNIAVNYLDESNDIRTQGIFFMIQGKQREADSCEFIGQNLIQKYNNTKNNWLPKPFRTKGPKPK